MPAQAPFVCAIVDCMRTYIYAQRATEMVHSWGCIIAQQVLPDLATVEERSLSHFFIGAAVLPNFEFCVEKCRDAGSPGANVVVCARCR